MPSCNDTPPSFLLFLAFGVILGGLCVSSTVQAVRYSTQGIQTVGTVTDCLSTSREGGQTCHYDFQVGKTTYSGSESSRGYQQGSSIAVYYLANDPANNASSPPNWLSSGFLELVGAIVLLGLAVRQFMNTDDIIND